MKLLWLNFLVHFCSDVNKDLGRKVKAKAKDSTCKAKAKAKDSTCKAKAKAKDLQKVSKAKAKDLHYLSKAKAKDFVILMTKDKVKDFTKKTDWKWFLLVQAKSK